MAKKLFLNVSFTLFALMLCMGVLCNFSKASDIPDNAKDMFIADIESVGQSYSTFQSAYDDAFSYDYVTYVKNGSYFLWIFQRYEFASIGMNTENGSAGYLYITNPDNNWGSAGFRTITNYFNMNNLNAGDIVQYVVEYDSSGYYNFYGYYLEGNSVQSASWFTLAEYPSNSYSSVSGQYNAYNPRLGRMSGRNFSNGNTFAFTDIVTNHNFYTCNYSDGKCLLFIDNWDSIYPSAVEDDRLSIYSLESNNGKQLNIDISAFRSYTPAAFYNFSAIDLTLNCDGSEVSYTLDSNNSNIIDIWSSSNNVYTVQTLYSYFDLDSYDDVYISEVDFTLTVTSPGGSGDTDFQIACQYYLKKTHESMEPVIVPDPEYNNTEIYNSTQINSIKQDLHEYSSRFSFLQGSWNFVLEQDLPEFPGWATVYQNYVWFADGNSDTTYRGHWFQMANNIPSIADLTRPFDPSDFLEQNKTFAFYDVILLKVFTVEVLSGSSVIENYDLAGYLVFISDRYYDHYNARLNLDILTQLQLSAENSVLFFDAAKARLDGIASDLDTGFNGFLDVGTGTQYKIISWLQTINDNMSGSFISLENTLSDGFSSVVTAIGNITPGGSSYSLPALSDALSFLFTPTLEWSAINYDDYQESLGVLALPFEFTFDVLDICEAQYDPKFKIHLNELSLDVPLEAGSDPDMTSFTVFEDQDIVQDPLDVIPSGLWSTLQYLNAFGLVMVQALSTYLHFFRKE